MSPITETFTFCEVTPREGQRARRRRVIRTRRRRPISKWAPTVTGEFAEACDNDTVNRVSRYPNCPSATVAFAIDTVSAWRGGDQVLPLGYGAGVMAMMLVIDGALIGTLTLCVGVVIADDRDCGGVQSLGDVEHTGGHPKCRSPACRWPD